MSLKRKLLAGGAAVLVAGGVAGAAIGASGQAGAVPSVRLTSTTRAGFLQATAEYLGTDVETLRKSLKPDRTLADIADTTPGRSANQLADLLASAAIARLEWLAGRALSNSQQRSLDSSLRRSIAGFLNGTCPLGLAGLAQDLGGCPGMPTKSLAHGYRAA